MIGTLAYLALSSKSGVKSDRSAAPLNSKIMTQRIRPNFAQLKRPSRAFVHDHSAGGQ
jgi:hypothetical protein